MAPRIPERRQLALLFLVTIGSLLACEDSQGPVVPESFRLQIVIADARGDPVPGLRISAFNNVPDWVLQDPSGPPCAPTASTSKVLGRATLAFCVPESARVRITALDVEHTPLRLLWNETLPPGQHTLAWDQRDETGNPLPGGLYVFQFDAFDPGNSHLLFSDSELALYHRGAEEILGFTDGSGRIEIPDRKRFPTLFDPGPLQARDADGNDRGAFRILDSVTIVAVDTLTWRAQCFTREIIDAPQVVRLTWSPTSQTSGTIPQPTPAKGGVRSASIPVPGPADWSSCSLVVVPNPYN